MVMSDEQKLEENYLKEVYDELTASHEELSNKVKKSTEEGRSALQTIDEDVRLNHDNISDNLETYAMLEMKNREIDQMNIRIKTAEIELKKVTSLLDSPYFGKINVDFLDEEPAMDFYIGISNFTNKDGEIRIYDWRSPVSELFYNNKLGSSTYIANGNSIHVSINNRRQFIIEEDRLIKFFDTSIAIQDDILLEALERDSQSLMRDITSTIQKEQNVIIRDTENPIILVNGIAGSGKTSTIMQRIAYLLYLLQKKITSDDILILSPNHQFIQYVSDVLPSLGEKNPLNLTMIQFVQKYSNIPLNLEEEEQYFSRINKNKVDEQTKILREKKFVDYLRGSDELLLSNLDFFKEIRFKGKVIITKEKILEIYHSTPDYPQLIDKLQATKKRLSSYWESQLTTQAKSKRIQSQILSLTEDVQKKYFGELIADDSEAGVIRYGRTLLRKKYQRITKAIQQIQWIDNQKMLYLIYSAYTEKNDYSSADQKSLDEAVILMMISQIFIEKINLPKMNFVLIDEVQDYTPAQLSLLIDLFPHTAFTMVGDENQAIFNSSIDFTNIIRLFKEKNQDVKQYNLLSSYRSSGAITKTFRQLVTNDEKMEIIPIRPDGDQPKLFKFTQQTDLLSILEGIFSELSGSLTIITKSEAEAKEVAGLMKKNFIEGNNQFQVLPISLSKGLEFDQVLIYDVSSSNYHTDRDKKILYTSISRAMQKLFITYKGEKSPFISEFSE
ncbi:HelD family protein [Enterococcus sp. CWB-B31]|uniref:HelD family protein n=1 Tax=Enterococcus sp. CWB-B31 TaxID=2885159 RepID=UPI001E312C58|nr:UvrD-helicase domain-containing protein [Enterococcus sp. CWB-B31]MCB5955635.1 AAA family ATPase [Enterococcus sp. CWB-B31]